MKKLTILLLIIAVSQVTYAQHRKTKKTQADTKVIIGETTITGDEPSPPPPPMYDPNTVVSELPEPAADTTDPVYTLVEKMPEFPGGADAMAKYIAKNIKYPKADEVLEGRAYVQFIVRPDGSITDVVVLRGMYGNAAKAYNDEALRLVKSMPKWNPGIRNGKNVSVQYIVPITFANH